ncbi:hypothetical protein PROFUN_12293 [Planoprotostelium fungivorum]|uniref:Uncharacterized protein n=1 Tax=Planoprotostelium fungivorum TaxID=1890364 RepID=A0A2P6N7S4_9EUKA|nr:hypothetical protein PROFUN_12293 [Planoprotostelium fungivorum]
MSHFLKQVVVAAILGTATGYYIWAPDMKRTADKLTREKYGELPQKGAKGTSIGQQTQVTKTQESKERNTAE